MLLTMRIASRAAAALLAAATVLIPSCARYVDDARAVAGPDRSALAESEVSQCEAVDAPLTTIPAQRNEEPVLKIPQPSGWTRTPKLDSERSRFTMVNRSLSTDGFASSVVVTLESMRGIEEPDVVFGDVRGAMESGFGATDLRVTEHTLCGLPAQMMHFQTPVLGGIAPHPASALVAVLHTDGTTYAVSVVVQTADPDDPVYQRDTDTILTGFQMLPPSPS